MKKNQSIAILVLEDGSIFRGQSVGYKGVACGEVVFNTSMSGYQEILSDPSYSGQMVTLTYPHVGNVGANDEDMESAKLFAQALIIKDLPRLHSNWRSTSSLGEFLEHHQCVAIAGIDTRQLTRLIREKGAQNACIMYVDDGDDMDEAIKQALSNAKAQDSMQGQDLAIKVSTKKSYQWREPTWDIEGDKKTAAVKYNVAAYDYGVKHNILRLLVDHGCAVTVYPADTPASDILSKNYDGVFLSNGPGDPEPCDYAITAIKEILDADKPIFGICLGHQLLSLAVGAKTHKMKFGHHGANHPVIDLDSQQVLITSQNHGFAVDQDNMPSNVRVTHRSLFDQTVQGIEVTDKAAFSFQGHPEASPGPHDIQYLFARFCQLMDTHKAQV